MSSPSESLPVVDVSAAGVVDVAALAPASARDCWNRIGVSGDRTCPELSIHIHCRNCPVYADAARVFFDRPAPDGYLAEWTEWLAAAPAVGQDTEDDVSAKSRGEVVSVLIFRIRNEWLAVATRAVAEVTTPRPVHRIPHRSNAILTGLVNLRGQLQLCVSLHGLLGIGEGARPEDASGQPPEGASATMAPKPRLVVLRDKDRSESWVFPADEVQGIHRVPKSRLSPVPATLADPTVSFSEAVLPWEGRSVGLLDEERIFLALRSHQP